MGFRYVVDQFHDQYCLAYARAAEKTDLTALCVGTDQIYYFNTGLKDLRCRCLFFKGGRGTVDRPALCGCGSGLIVYRLAKQIEDSTEALLAYRNSDGAAKINSVCSANKSVSGTHGNASDDVVTDLLSNFGDQFAAIH